MKRQTFKNPGDAALQRLLEKYNCPTAFHVVRMRFLGEIASLDFGASPIKTIESFWEAEGAAVGSLGDAYDYENVVAAWTA